MANVVCLDYIHTIHIHTIKNKLFNGCEVVTYSKKYLLREYGVSDTARVSTEVNL